MAGNPKFTTPALKIEYRRAREGPNSYLVWEPHKSYICLTGKDVLKATKWPKGTSTGTALREWLDQTDNLTSPTPAPEAVNTDSWGPEAHDAEPNDNCKTVI